MFHVDTITLQAGIVDGQPWAVLVDQEGGLVAACPPIGLPQGHWTPFHDALNIEAFEAADVWLYDPTHVLHIALSNVVAQGPAAVLSAAMAYVEKTVATAYDGASVEVAEGAFRVHARSHTQTATRAGKPRPKLTNRIDVWI
jgi:hypothetical protein